MARNTDPTRDAETAAREHGASVRCHASMQGHGGRYAAAAPRFKFSPDEANHPGRPWVDDPTNRVAGALLLRWSRNQLPETLEEVPGTRTS